MIHRILAALALLTALLAAPLAHANDVVVVTHPGTTITPAEVRDIYTGEKTLAGSTKLVPVDNAAAQEAFLAQYVKLDANKYTAAWTKKAFRDGLSAPAVKASDAEVIDFVKRTPGAVGYVKAAPAAGVNVVK